MLLISHQENVIHLQWSRLKPSPQLVLEYARFKTLEEQKTLSPEDCKSVLLQGLSALKHLHHEIMDKIVHRDIKPANILVTSENPLRVKLADFGLSKAGPKWETACGTAYYAAPEIYDGEYSPSIDIWSLGVVIFRCASRLPDDTRCTHREWCKKIVKEVNRNSGGVLTNFLSKAMLIMDPTKRLSAKDCYDKVLELNVSQERHGQSPETKSLQEHSSEHGPSSETDLPLSCKSASTRSSENGRSSERKTVMGKTVIGKRQSSPPTQRLSKRRRRNTNISSRQIQLEQSKQQSLFDSKCDGSKDSNNLRPSQAGSPV
jgi:serine/threonine protein kinase